jgi:pyruvate, water dikinase
MTSQARFPSPYQVKAPKGAEGWERLYPYYLVFRDNLRDKEERKFWFCDSQHWPSPFKPFDAVTVEFAVKCLGQYNTRHYLIPPANGVDYRIHNGYCYMSPVAVAPELIAGRVPQFMERAGYYFQNWASLLANWDKKVRANIADLEALRFEPLPEMVPLDWVKGGVGLDNTYALMETYDRTIQLLYKTWQYHFEFLNLGYAAYLDFFGFVKQQFPSIPDLSIAKMVQGVEVDLFRPDDELKKLAKLAVTLKVADALKTGSVDAVLKAVAARPGGREWLDAWKAAQDPWFNFTSGNGFYSTDKYWIEHLDIPLGYIRDYVVRLEKGEKIDRPTAKIAAERDRITAEYAELLDQEARAGFEAKLGLARTVFPYVENHNFYIEHWSMGVFWRKMRELSDILHKAGFWVEPDDMFYLSRQEVRDALFDYGNAWAVGTDAIGPSHWPAEIAARKRIMAALATQAPQPALNEPPAVITEPFTIMLWGITTDRINAWLQAGHGTAANGTGNGKARGGVFSGWRKGSSKSDGAARQLTGMAASPGQVEGLARVIRSADELDQVQDGEILVTPVTAPSWAPVFGKISATVTDIGGMMSHAAIVCREYGLPAVTATGSGSTAIKTGQRLRVDGTTGQVTILS